MSEVTRVERLRRDGGELVYDEIGTGSRALVLVHGFGGSRRDFALRLGDLAAFGRTVAVDLRGHGESAHCGNPAAYTFPKLVEDLFALLEEVGPPCDVLGHSFGGMVVLRAVLARPALFASLILMDTAARCPDGIPLGAFQLARELARREGMARLHALLRERADDDPTRTEADRRLERAWEGYGDWRRARLLAMDPEAYAALGRALVEQDDLAPRLREIRVPTLVLVGAEDRDYLAAAKELAGGIPGAQRVVLPDAGHQPQLENPRAWLAAIREHLARARGAPESTG